MSACLHWVYGLLVVGYLTTMHSRVRAGLGLSETLGALRMRQRSGTASERDLPASLNVFALQELSLHASVETFNAWVAARQRRAAADDAARHEEELQALRDKLSARDADALSGPRRHIVENILTLKCPRCKAAFFDFTDCLALKCATCTCGFCACCMTDCGQDAHAHVRHSCAYAKASRPGGATSATQADTVAAQNAWRIDALRDYLAAHVAADKQSVLLDSLTREFADITLDVGELYIYAGVVASGSDTSVNGKVSMSS